MERRINMNNKYEGKGKKESKMERRIKNESGTGTRKTELKVERRVIMKMGKEREKMNQRWKGE